MSKTSDYHDSPHSIITTDQTLREQIKEILMEWNNACSDAEANQILKLIEERIPKEIEEDPRIIKMNMWYRGWNEAIAEMKKEMK